MSGSDATLKLRPALLRPVRRRDAAIAATVLLSSAFGGALVALMHQATPPAPAQVSTLALHTPVAQGGLAPARGPAPAAAAVPEAALPFDLAPVIHEGGLRVVIETNVEPEWLGRAIVVSDHEGVRVVERPLGENGTARFSRLVGARLRLVGAAGPVCVAEVRGVSAVGRFAPEDFGETEPSGDAPAAWDAAAGSHLIAGDLAAIEGDCTGAHWAQPAELAPPVLAEVKGAGALQTRRAADLLRAAPDFAERTGGAAATIDVDAITLEGGETLLVASALVEGCADQEPVMSALYAVQADGSMHPVGPEADLTVGSIAAAADFDGDGHVEILVKGDVLDSSILRRRAAGYQEEAHAAVPIYGCRC